MKIKGKWREEINGCHFADGSPHSVFSWHPTLMQKWQCVIIIDLPGAFLSANNIILQRKMVEVMSMIEPHINWKYICYVEKIDQSCVCHAEECHAFLYEATEIFEMARIWMQPIQLMCCVCNNWWISDDCHLAYGWSEDLIHQSNGCDKCNRIHVGLTWQLEYLTRMHSWLTWHDIRFLQKKKGIYLNSKIYKMDCSGFSRQHQSLWQFNFRPLIQNELW